MGIVSRFQEWAEFEGKIIGRLSDKAVEKLSSEDLSEKQQVALNSALSEIEKKISDSFEEKEELMQKIELQAKLRLLIQERMKGVKKIPQEYVDKYNEVVTGIWEIVQAQVVKENGNEEKDANE